MERRVEVFTIDDISIEFPVIGKGEPILVFHGGHSNCREEFGYKALVENGYSIITPSRAGYGNTSKELGESLTIACEHYAKLLTHLQVNKVHVIAISAGGPCLCISRKSEKFYFRECCFYGMADSKRPGV